MSTVERSRFRALAIRAESTPGTDVIAGSPTSTDWIDAQFSISPDFIVTRDPSFTGSLDSRPGVVGGGRFVISGVRVPIRGSGAAATAPEWFRILQAAGMVNTSQTAVGAPTAATAGSATTATLQAPFAATANLYRFMPVTLSGNPSTARTTLITDYTVGRVATFSRTFSPVLDTNTLAIIPANNTLRLTDTETDFQRLTVYAYEAGQLFIGTGCIALNPRIRLSVAEMAMLEFDLLGTLANASPAETALPAAASAVSRPTPPTWRDGECQFGRALRRGAEAVFALGSGGLLTPNPENANGFDVAELMSRDPRCEISFMANSTASPGQVTTMRNGSDTVFSAILGTAAGNRIGFVFSPGRVTQIRRAEREGADVDVLTLEPALAGGSVGITSF